MSSICSLLTVTAHAGAGKEPFQFLFLDADARPAALGGAYSALSWDANALLYNPAGLGLLSGHQAVLMRNQHAADISQDYLALALEPGFGFFLDRVGYGSIPRTTVSNPAGSGTFSPWDMALGAGIGREALPGMSLGAALKHLSSDIAGRSASGFAFDAGLLLHGAGPLSAGFSLQNLGPPLRYGNADEPLPLNLRLGTALALSTLGQDITFSLEASKGRSARALFSGGAELVLGERTSLRAGFNGRNEAGTGACFGLGWAFKGLGLGYAFVPMGDLGSAHRLSLSLRWGAQARAGSDEGPSRAEEALKAIRR